MSHLLIYRHMDPGSALGDDFIVPEVLSKAQQDAYAEFVVKEGARITRSQVKDISLPKGVTIGGLVRDGEGILVTGSTQIQPGDHVVAFCLASMIKRIEKYFN